jgi:hypothetical protein
MAQAQNPREAYENGYADGLRMAEQMRWQGTPIGNMLKGACYTPDRYFHAAYDDGFKQAMDAACRVEWSFPERTPGSLKQLGTVGAKRWLSAA